jgi:hypothetical protein
MLSMDESVEQRVGSLSLAKLSMRVLDLVGGANVSGSGLLPPLRVGGGCEMLDCDGAT